MTLVVIYYLLENSVAPSLLTDKCFTTPLSWKVVLTRGRLSLLAVDCLKHSELLFAYLPNQHLPLPKSTSNDSSVEWCYCRTHFVHVLLKTWFWFISVEALAQCYFWHFLVWTCHNWRIRNNWRILEFTAFMYCLSWSVLIDEQPPLWLPTIKFVGIFSKYICF